MTPLDLFPEALAAAQAAYVPAEHRTPPVLCDTDGCANEALPDGRYCAECEDFDALIDTYDFHDEDRAERIDPATGFVEERS